MPMPPRPEPNQASAVAKAGIERAPPISAAIGFKATTEIQTAPNETPRITSDRLAVIHDALVSMLALAPADIARFSRGAGSERAARSRTSPCSAPRNAARPAD